MTGLVLLAFSLAVFAMSTKMEMFFGSIPGSGFLPYWLSLILAALSLMLIASSVRQPALASRAIAWPRGQGLVWIAVTLLGLCTYILAIPFTGYILATAAYVGVVIWMLGSYRWFWATTLGLTVSVALYLIFQVWLVMSIPTGALIIP